MVFLIKEQAPGVKEAQVVAVYSLFSGSRVSRVVPDQGAVSRYQGGAVWSSLCSYISSGDSRVVVSVFVLGGAVLDIKEAHFSESIYDNKKTRRGWLVQFSSIKE